jgi:hypothetical protein
MREMEMDYVDVQKESIDKGPKAMSLEGAKNSPSFKYIYAIRKKLKSALRPHGHSTSHYYTQSISCASHHNNQRAMAPRPKLLNNLVSNSQLVRSQWHILIDPGSTPSSEF